MLVEPPLMAPLTIGKRRPHRLTRESMMREMKLNDRDVE
jgi:hypothetical protein